MQQRYKVFVETSAASDVYKRQVLVFLLEWVVVVLVVEVSGVVYGENRDAEKVRNRRYGKERSVTKVWGVR